MSDKHFKLVTLGWLALLDETGQPAALLSKHPRKLVLLAVLALARRPMTRDRLVEMFWGEQDEGRARHSLSDALSEIRHVLGPDAVSARSDSVGLAADVPLDADAAAFQTACATRDWARAIALYGGAFLDGVFVKDAPSFETWCAAERNRLEQLFLKACAAHVAALVAAEQHEEAAAIAARWLSAQPLAPEPALAMLSALRAPGTPAAERAALAAYDRLAARLAREYDELPDPRLVAVAGEIRTV
ncbi:MAG: AfsR/SARP family transcriptional regulator, partial [Polyangiaceae bacterium]